MKKIYKILIIILFIIMSILLVLSFLKINDLNNKLENCNIITEEDNKSNAIAPNFDEDTKYIETSEEVTTLLNKIYDYVDSLSLQNIYMDFSKKNDVYYISLKELNEKYGYDISIFKDENGNICDTENSGIYYDVDHILNKNYTDDSNVEIIIFDGCFEALK